MSGIADAADPHLTPMRAPRPSLKSPRSARHGRLDRSEATLLTVVDHIDR